MKFIIQHALLLGYGVFSILSFALLIIKRPFSLLLLKRVVDDIYRTHPAFIAINYWISFFWGLIFLASAISVGLPDFGIGTQYWMKGIFPLLFFTTGFVLTFFFPYLYQRYIFKQKGVARLKGLSSIKNILIANKKIAYRTLGEGPMLILLQGYRMNMHSWEPQLLEKLSQHFKVFLWDYPNTGHSEKTRESLTLDLLSDYLHEIIKKLNLNPCAIVGYSLGGFLAQHFIAQHPKQTKTVVIIGACLSGKEATLCSQKIIDKFSDLSGNLAQQAKRLLSLMFPDEIKSKILNHLIEILAAAQLEGKVTKPVVKQEQDILKHWCYGKSIALSLKDAVNKNNISALVIAGKKDELIPFENAMAFNEIFNRSKIITLENAGHGLIYQCPIEIADEITKWCLAQNIKNTRPIKSYVRREGRITPAQKKALQELWPKYGLNMDSGRLNLEQVFNRNAKTILEIGFGMGDSLIQMAQENSDINFIGIDVYAPGVGSILNRIEKNKLKNVKIFHADAVDVLKQAIPDKSLARIHIYFPDPWQKKRHHKRRLIQKDFIALLSKKLQKGGILHIVTDHDDYATHILDATFGVRHQKLHQRTINRPVTKFEKRAKKLGHQIHEFEFVLE